MNLIKNHLIFLLRSVTVKNCITRFPLKHCVVGMNPTCSWRSLLWWCTWILRATILLRIFASVVISVPVPLWVISQKSLIHFHWHLSYSHCLGCWEHLLLSWGPRDRNKKSASYFEGRGGEWIWGGTSSLCPGMRIPGLQMRFSKVCSLTQGHTASLWQSYDLRRGLPDAKGDAPRTNNQNITNIIMYNIKSLICPVLF